MMVASRVGGILCTCYWLYLAPVWERFVVASLGGGRVAGTSYKRERTNGTRAFFFTTIVLQSISSWENVGRLVLAIESNKSHNAFHGHQRDASFSYRCLF